VPLGEELDRQGTALLRRMSGDLHIRPLAAHVMTDEGADLRVFLDQQYSHARLLKP
jgi:hypothetical protein